MLDYFGSLRADYYGFLAKSLLEFFAVAFPPFFLERRNHHFIDDHRFSLDAIARFPQPFCRGAGVSGEAVIFLGEFPLDLLIQMSGESVAVVIP